MDLLFVLCEDVTTKDVAISVSIKLERAKRGILYFIFQVLFKVLVVAIGVAIVIGVAANVTLDAITITVDFFRLSFPWLCLK
jgi:hypothetical protein